MILAIDIGASKTLLAVFDHNGQAHDNHQFATTKNQSAFYKTLLSQLKKFDLKAITAIGIGAPAAINYQKKMIVYCPNLPWRNFNLSSRLHKQFKVPVALDNDCNLAALSEARWGAGKNYRSVLYTTISTGVGTGLVVDHRVPYPLQRMEAGSMFGQIGSTPKIWEDIISGPAIIKKYGKPAWEITNVEQWDSYAHNLSLYLLSLITAFGPDVVVLGGGVANHLPKFQKSLNKSMRKYKSSLLYPLSPLPPIRKAKHVETAVIYGCYLAAKTASIKSK